MLLGVHMVDPHVNDDVLVCVNMLEYSFVSVYFDMSQKFSKKFHLTWTKYIWNIPSYTCSHAHEIVILLLHNPKCYYYCHIVNDVTIKQFAPTYI